jgi:serine/threonine protein phosphatase PrpC
MGNRETKILAASYQGINRNINKDGILTITCDSYALLGVFDGVSSAKDSDKAVRIALKFITEKHSKYYKDNILDISSIIYDLNLFLVASDVKEPYSTCSMLWIPCDEGLSLKYLNIGDSRIYSITNQFIEKLTIDDSDPYNRNVLLKYLGDCELTKDDLKVSDYIGNSERFILCSDGFYSFFEKDSTLLLEFHRILNMNHTFYIKNNIEKLIVGTNSDDATYVLARCRYV